MGNLIKEWVKGILTEDINKKVVVYAGRFQPFHKGHYATYSHLVKQFGKDNIYIGTSDKTDNIKSPFKFKEKKVIMMKMFGIPSDKIIQIKNPYAPTEIIGKFPEESTAFITVVGEKDRYRLKGKYFEPYHPDRVESGYKDKGYVYVAPAQSNPISGTDVRNWLSKGSEEQRKSGFKKAYGKFDPKIFKLVSDKLFKIESKMERFINSFDMNQLMVEAGIYNADAGEPETGYLPGGTSRVLGNNFGKPEPWYSAGGYTQMEFPKADYIYSKDSTVSDKASFSVVKRVEPNRDLDTPIESDDYLTSETGEPIIGMNEASSTGPLGKSLVDDGPGFTYGNSKTYKKVGEDVAQMLGWQVVDYILGSDEDSIYADNERKLDDKYPVSYFPSGIAGIDAQSQRYTDLKGSKAYKAWSDKIKGVATSVGYKLIDFLDAEDAKTETSGLNEGVLNEDLFGTSLKLKPYETLMVKAVVAFMMDKFNFKAKIIVKKKEKAGMIGDISLNSNSVDGNKFYLHFNPNQSYKRIIQSMIHELTHVKQVSKNELLPNKDYTAILWKGKEYIGAKEYGRLMKTDVASYVKLPWEVEANSNMTSLYPQFIKSKYWLELKGKDDTLDYIINTNENTLNEGLLVEGGAYGHMNHPFDVEMNLTFGDLKAIIKGALNGNLELAREKTDGQALAISWRDDRGLIAARNKSHLKNKGAEALTIKGVADKFANRGGLTDAYNFAMKDLESAIKGLSKAQRDTIFQQGASFMNLEVIYPTSVNVIPYDQPLLVFHNTTEYNEKGEGIGANQSAARILAGMIKQINKDVQSNYTIQGPPVTELPKSQKLSAQQSKFESMLKKLQSEFKLKDSDGVADYHQAWWEQWVDKNSPETLTNDEKMGLVKRWAFNDKGFRLDDKNIKSSKVLDWAKKVDKLDRDKISKENTMKFEEIFLGVGAEVLSFMSSVLAANPDKAVRDMKKELDTTIKAVQKSGDPKKIEKLRLELERLARLGGKEKIVPNEGIVFVYKGNTYKLTGAFAPVNQILGLMYF
jgi:hypothetical protein